MNNEVLPARNSSTVIVFPANKSTSSTVLGDDSLVVAGLLYTIAATNLIVWPLAYVVRKLPILRDIL